MGMTVCVACLEYAEKNLAARSKQSDCHSIILNCVEEGVLPPTFVMIVQELWIVEVFADLLGQLYLYTKSRLSQKESRQRSFRAIWFSNRVLL